MSKFEELKARIDKEYKAVTNTINVGNNEYLYLWGVLDDLDNIVVELETKVDYELMSEEEAYESLCMRIKHKLNYLRNVNECFDNKLPFTFAVGVFFSLTNLINEIDERNN